MKLLLIGPQGCGKGTQGKIISSKLGIPHVCTGDLLRGASGGMKDEIDAYINKGNLIPDELMVEILKERLEKEDCAEGFILDGFPRNMEQAKMLDGIVKIDKVIEISISDEEAVRRLSGRAACEDCGAGFNSVTLPPKEEGKCDKCEGKLVQREDDKEDAIKKRLAIYHKETEPLLEYYDGVKINGEQSVERVSAEVFRVLESY